MIRCIRCEADTESGPLCNACLSTRRGVRPAANTQTTLETMIRVVAKVAMAKDRESPSLERCECFFTLGQVKHTCLFCEARAAIKAMVDQ